MTTGYGGGARGPREKNDDHGVRNIIIWAQYVQGHMGVQQA